MINETGISECNLDSEPSNNQKLIKIAKKMLFKEVFASWRIESNFEYDKEKDERCNYRIWLKQIKRDYFNGEDCVNDIFEEMSLTDIKTFFEDDLYETFSETIERKKQ